MGFWSAEPRSRGLVHPSDCQPLCEYLFYIHVGVANSLVRLIVLSLIKIFMLNFLSASIEIPVDILHGSFCLSLFH